MDFERFFPFIILLIIWGVSSAIRKSPREKAANKPVTGGGGLLSLLQNRIQAAIEAAGEAEDTVALDHYMQPVSPESVYPQAKIDVTRLRSQAAVRSDRSAGDAKTVMPIKVIDEPRQRRAIKRRVDLKNAVIWAEIIGPPVSMRD